MLYRCGKCFTTKFKSNFIICTKRFTATTTNKPTFDDLIKQRRDEANRSLVVQVSSEKSFPELYNYCSQFGSIICTNHYRIPSHDLHYILIEFKDVDSTTEVLNSTCYEESAGVPVRSPFLWFKAGGSRKLKQNVSEGVILSSVNSLETPNDSEINGMMQSAQNLEDQVKIICNSIKLNDLGVRLRFLSAKQIENAVSGMFPYANAAPFGSSVNGFGKMGSDLDLILRFDDDNAVRKTKYLNSRLVFHTKEYLTNGRSQTQRQMEAIGDMLQLFLPGISNVRRILQARVPIIKFHHDHLNLEVDLSMGNLTGAYMSELLYMFGEIDDRLRPLIFCIQKWAHTSGLTNPSPGRWITNFSLSCLVIFFLQQLKMPILPKVNLLIKSATSNDIRITEDGVNCTFLRDFNQLKFQSKNQSTISDLLLQFFEFYSQFDFQNRAISLNEGCTVVKPDHSAIYIVNPLEQVLNVSKNVSLEECERFRIEVRNAAWILESEMVNNIRVNDSKQQEDQWGVMNLFKNPDRIIRSDMFFRSRMVEVKELFNDEQVKQNTKIDFKNPSIRSKVKKIKAQFKNDIKQISLDINGEIFENPKGQSR